MNISKTITEEKKGRYNSAHLAVSHSTHSCDKNKYIYINK